MTESQRPHGVTTPKSTPAAVPVSAYVMALISGVFVTFGVMICVAFSHLFFGEWVPSAPRPVLAAIPVVAIGLGIMSAWQSVRQAKRKAIEEPKSRAA